MKEVLSLFTFGIGALCFVVFVTVFKPTAVRRSPWDEQARLLQHEFSEPSTSWVKSGQTADQF